MLKFGFFKLGLLKYIKNSDFEVKDEIAAEIISLGINSLVTAESKRIINAIIFPILEIDEAIAFGSERLK